MQSQDGSFVGITPDGMVAFDTTGGVRWTANDYPIMATADGGVIGQSGIIYDQNGSATGQIPNMPTYSWLGYAYQTGSVDQVVRLPLFAAQGFWSFLGGSSSPNNSADDAQRFPPLASCTDKGGTCQGPLGPRDLLWNAKVDLVNQLKNDKACQDAAQSYVLSKLTDGDVNGAPITTKRLADYINQNPTFYDGSRSTQDFLYAKCGNGYYSFNCQGSNPPRIIKDMINDPSTQTTAIAVTPSFPFLSFWRPTYSPPQGDQDQGFGWGIDPNNYGANIFNESILLHEALHGLTGKDDLKIEGYLGQTEPSLNISIYIKNNVLSKCPSFK